MSEARGGGRRGNFSAVFPRVTQTHTQHHVDRPKMGTAELSEESLKSNGVHFSPKVHGPGDFPTHVDAVRAILLDFGSPVFKDFRGGFEKDLKEFQNLPPSKVGPNEEIRSLCPTKQQIWDYPNSWSRTTSGGMKRKDEMAEAMDVIFKTSKKFRERKEDFDREAAWMRSLTGELFKEFDQDAKERTDRYIFAYNFAAPGVC